MYHSKIVIMRNLLLLPIGILMFSNLIAQVQFRPLPEAGFEERITNFVNELELSDSHEHLMNPERIKHSSMLDFMLLLHHYADDDIKSAGMSKAQFAELLTDKYTIKEKWKIVEPFWEASKNTTYNRVVLLAIDRMYGIDELNDATVEEVSRAIKNAYQGDWYEHVLKDKAGIRYAILDIGKRRLDDDMFRYVEKFDQFIRIDSRENIATIGEQSSLEIVELDDLVRALEITFRDAVARGIVGVKSAAAYHRPLNYEHVSNDRASEVLQKLLENNHDESMEFATLKPLQDYMMHQLVQQVRKYNIPFQIHTGFHAGDGNIISNSNPTLLTNLFLEYRDVKFILFHGSYPYGGELTTLAKSFRNVYLDMSWVYIISPSYAERYLHEWLETVPSNKIMAYGGDYHNVENAYGHSLIARAVVAQVLVDKVRDGYFTEAEAKQTAERILLTNVIDLFEIE